MHAYNYSFLDSKFSKKKNLIGLHCAVLFSRVESSIFSTRSLKLLFFASNVTNPQAAKRGIVEQAIPDIIYNAYAPSRHGKLHIIETIILLGSIGMSAGARTERWTSRIWSIFLNVKHALQWVSNPNGMEQETKQTIPNLKSFCVSIFGSFFSSK